MQFEARMFLHPPPDFFVFVRAVIVKNQVQVEVWRKLRVELAQELQELLVSVTRLTLADDLSIENIERREQRRSAVTDIVVGMRPASPLDEGQTWLGAVQSLNLALLVHAENDSSVRRVEIDADNVRKFLDEVFVLGEFEGPAQMRLKSMEIPDALNSLETDILGFRHGAATPMGLSRRLGVLGGFDNRGNPARSVGGLSTSPRSNFRQSLRSSLRKALLPETNRGSTYTKELSNLPVALALISVEDDHAAQDNSLGSALRANPAFHEADVIRCGVDFEHGMQSDPRWRKVQAICDTLH